MQALVLEDYMQLTTKDIATPQVGTNDVLVQVAACGICGSDVHGFDGSTGRRRPPVVMGHEASGVVVEAGAGVTTWQPGDRVTFDSTVYCGSCSFCRAGRINLCDDRRVLGVSCEEYRQDGAFAEYVAVPERVLYRLPDNLSFTHAAMVEPVSIAFHATNRTPMTLNDSAVVFGAGIIGLLIVQTLRLAGYGTIVAVDLDNEKRELAKAMGADLTVNAQAADLVDQILNATGGGAVHAFEAVGIEETINAAFQTTRKGGSITLVGNLAPKVAFPLQAAVTREISLYGSCASSGEYPACLDMIARGQIDVAPLISAVVPLADGASWFQRLYKKEAGLRKVLLAPNGDL